jgi:hypothetical protein
MAHPIPRIDLEDRYWAACNRLNQAMWHFQATESRDRMEEIGLRARVVADLADALALDAKK